MVVYQLDSESMSDSGEDYTKYYEIMEKGREMDHQRKKDKLKSYFHYCPLCYSETGISFQFAEIGGKDRVICLGCGAHWHVYIGLNYNVKWVKLKIANVDGRGGGVTSTAASARILATEGFKEKTRG